jgi:hypothetical protein
VGASKDCDSANRAICPRGAAFLGRSLDTATAEDLRRYQLHLTNSGVYPPRFNATVSALRFFFPSRSTEPRSANC